MFFLIVETFRAVGESSQNVVRVRAVDPKYADYRVSCSTKMRSAWQVGQRFRMAVKWVEMPDAKSYLRMCEEYGWQPVDQALSRST